MRGKKDQTRAFPMINGSYWITETLKGLCSTKWNFTISQGKDRTSWVAEIKNVEDRIYCRFVIPLRRVLICEAFIS